MTIDRYILRGYYPNYKLLIIALENRYLYKGYNELSGYLPTEIELFGDDLPTPKLINVRYEDVLYLNSNKSKGNQYLQWIIESRDGDVEARKNLREVYGEFLESTYKQISGKKCYEDEFVLPSDSNKTYDNNLISHKGVRLLTLSQKGYPVPDFSILTSKSYLLNEEQRTPYIVETIKNLEIMTSSRLGCPSNPLIFAIRCAMPEYLPGLMPTYLNVGVTDTVYNGLKKIYNKEVAAKIYLQNLKTIYGLIFPSYDIPGHKQLMLKKDTYIEKFYQAIKEVDERILKDAFYQVVYLIKKAKEFYTLNQDLLYTFVKKGVHYPSLILQKMVWTVRGNSSYPGVLYSRHSRTGLGVQIESARNIFGEDIMTGMLDAEDTEYFSREEIKNSFPEVYHFHPILKKLEERLKSPATIEFAAESNNNEHYFAVLQLNQSEVTGRAMLLSAIDLYQKRVISAKRVIELIHPYHLTQVFSDRIDDASFGTMNFFSSGVSVLPRSAVSAKAYFSATEVLEAKKRGEKVCFCKENFIPSDTIVLSEVDAIISLTPAAIHVVTACKGYGIPAFLNLEKEGVVLLEKTMTNSRGITIQEGDWITLSSKKQKIFLGRANYKPARFKRYLAGEELKMEEKERNVFVNMSNAYHQYQDVVNALRYEEIVEVNDLIRLIQNELKEEPEKAKLFVNNWYESKSDLYVQQILSSELGTHKDQHTLYNMLSLDKKVHFFKQAISQCIDKQLKGYTAGSFMLGRFICIKHPIAFWEQFKAKEISFLLSESIFFEKYLHLLNVVGERKINRARKKILNEGLQEIQLQVQNAKIFVTLKLSNPDWKSIQEIISNGYDAGVIQLVENLMQPFGELYNYNTPWSIGELEDICKESGRELPDPEDI